jgi:prepilin-type N-terminal cleavage/methylation domain-containing protein
LLAERIRRESGYSLVEVMASIVILSLAILPMVGMFDTGLKSATAGSNYDKARALANLKMEEAKSLPFANVRDNFPETAPTTTTYNGSGQYVSAWKTQPGAVFTNFQYRITKQFMVQPPTDSDLDPANPSETFATSTSATSLIRVTVTVQWEGNSYETLGLVAE